MMNQIPPLAWIIIVLVILLTVAINFGLIALLRNRSMGGEFAKRLRARRASRTAQSVQRFQEVLRDPFRQEREQLHELSDLVNRLNSPSATESTVEDQPGVNQENQPPQNSNGHQ